MAARFVSLLLVALAVVASASVADPHRQEFYAAPDGRPNGDGSRERPWDLQTALNGPAVVQPGATIWLRGGTYRGGFVSRVSGREGAYVTIRAYGAERPILDNAAGGPTKAPPLDIQGAWVTIWGLEITSTNPDRKSAVDLPAEDDFRPNGISVLAPHTRLINNVVHDTGTCIGHWNTATHSEIYGNLIYFCGWEGPTRGHGHGLYIQNAGGVKDVRDNIIFAPFASGIHAYSSGGAIDDLHFTRNVVFQSSRLSSINLGRSGDFIVGGGKVAHRPVLDGNFTYTPRGTSHLGYNAGTQDAQVTSNYFVHTGGTALTIVLPRNLAMSGNTFVGPVTDAGRYQDNRFEAAPTGTWRFVLPNAYDPARATIVIYNWDGAATVAVDPGSVLAPGDVYEIRSVENYFAGGVRHTYNGGPVPIPMQPGTIGVPIGWHAPPESLPEFGVFVLVKHATPSS